MKTVSTATICISPFMSGLSQELHVHPHLPSALPLSEEGTILMSLEDILKDESIPLDAFELQDSFPCDVPHSSQSRLKHALLKSRNIILV